MRIDISEITNGSYEGKHVFICDLRYRNLDEKPIRKVLPQEVFVRSNEETKRKIYYSGYHFCGLNKKGEPLKSKIIPPFDGTGFRMYAGEPVNVFSDRDSCLKHFEKQKKGILSRLDEWFEGKKIRYKDLKSNIADM